MEPPHGKRFTLLHAKLFHDGKVLNRLHSQVPGPTKDVLSSMTAGRPEWVKQIYHVVAHLLQQNVVLGPTSSGLVAPRASAPVGSGANTGNNNRRVTEKDRERDRKDSVWDLFPGREGSTSAKEDAVTAYQRQVESVFAQGSNGVEVLQSSAIAGVSLGGTAAFIPSSSLLSPFGEGVLGAAGGANSNACSNSNSADSSPSSSFKSKAGVNWQSFLSSSCHRFSGCVPRFLLFQEDAGKRADLADLLTKFQCGGPDGKTNLWIIKPANQSRGRGIEVVSDFGEVLRNVSIFFPRQFMESLRNNILFGPEGPTVLKSCPVRSAIDAVDGGKNFEFAQKFHNVPFQGIISRAKIGSAMEVLPGAAYNKSYGGGNSMGTGGLGSGGNTSGTPSTISGAGMSTSSGGSAGGSSASGSRRGSEDIDSPFRSQSAVTISPRGNAAKTGNLVTSARRDNRGGAQSSSVFGGGNSAGGGVPGIMASSGAGAGADSPKRAFGRGSTVGGPIMIVQKYIEQPFIIEHGSNRCGRMRTKFDIRQWMLVTDWESPRKNVRAWYFQEFYLRFGAREYDPNATDPFIHLTNNAVTKNCPEYQKNYVDSGGKTAMEIAKV